MISPRHLSLPLFCTAFVLALTPLHLAAQHTPEGMQEEREREHEERDRWMEERHRTAPGVNWRIIERENREAHMGDEGRFPRTLSSAGGPDTVGDLVGRWSERGSSNQAGRIVYADIELVHNPNIDTVGVAVYAASAGGHIWRGDFDGNNWTVLNDRQRFYGICYLNARETDGAPFLFAMQSSPGAGFYSTDGGTTWDNSTGLDSIYTAGGIISRVTSVDPNGDTLLALGNAWDYGIGGYMAYLYKSTDGGRHFTLIRKEPGDYYVQDVWGAGDGLGLSLFLDGDSLFRVSGNTLIPTATLPPIFGDNLESSQIIFVGTTAGGRLTLYAFRREMNNIVCYQSLDTGATWTQQGSTRTPFSRQSIAVSIEDPNTIMVGDVEMWMSTDGGVSWERRSVWSAYYGNEATQLHADIPAIVPLQKRANGWDWPWLSQWTWLVATDGGLYFGDKQLGTVSNISLNGLRVSQYYSSTTTADGKTLLVGAQDQGLQIVEKDTGGIVPMKQVVSGDYGHISTGDGSPNFWFVYPGFTIVRRADGTHLVRDFDGVGSRRLWMAPVTAIPGTIDKALIGLGGSQDGVRLWYLQAIDNAIAATELPYDFSASSHNYPISAVAVSPIDTSHWYVLTVDGTFFHSSDAGANWTVTAEYGGPGAQYFYGATILPSRRTLGRVWIGGSGYSNPAVFSSENHGATFDTLATGLPSTLVQELAADPDERHLFAATESGPYLCRLDTRKWYNLSGSAAPDQTWWDVDYIDTLRTARFVTYGRGVWDFTVEKRLADVSSREESAATAIDISPTVLHNGGSCRIAVTMPHAGVGSVRVYDAAGRMVGEPMREAKLGAGRTEVVWNSGSLPAGRYMAVLNALGSVRYAIVLKQ